MDIRVGDDVRHIADPTLPLRVVRIQVDWMGERIAVVQSFGGETFKVAVDNLEHARG